MAESTPPSPAAQPGPQKKRQPPGALSAVQTAELNKAEKLSGTASKIDYSAKLAARDISPESLVILQTDIDDCRRQSNVAVQKTTGVRVITRQEEELQKKLVGALVEIQAAARQKFRLTAPEVLADYFIGFDLNASRPDLEQYSEGIFAKAATDALPGITPEKITAGLTLRKAYLKIETDQSGGQSNATGSRTTRDDMVDSIKARRIAIQLAAEAEWPSTDKANAAIRTEFSLPANRPFLA